MLAAAALAGCGSAHPAANGTAATLKPVVDSLPPSAVGTPGATATVPRPSPSVTSGAAARTSTKPATAKPAAASSGSSGSSGPHGTAACVTSAAKFDCGPFTYPGIQGTSSNPTVGNNVWAPINGWHQTLYANNPGDWSVVANMPAGNTGVVSYPSSGSSYGERKLSSFSAMYSSFTENMNANGSTSAWAAYDIWLNGGQNEVMIQHDFANNGPCGPDATATFGGSGGVPSQRWYLCKYGSELIWKLNSGSETSGSVDILAMLKWLESHGDLPSDSTLGLIGYGWEICSTGSQPETFKVSRYSITTS